MGRLTPDEFRAKYAALPQNLREAYGSLDTTKILEDIGRKHGLLLDQIGELVNETGYVMLGATPPGDYISKISAATGIPREKAKEVAVDVNEQVFKPIRDALKQVHKIGGAGMPTTSGETPQPAPAPQEKTDEATSFTPPKIALTPESAPVSPPANISEERLTKPFSLPHEEKSYTVSEDGEEEISPPKHTYQMDPYREPTD